MLPGHGSGWSLGGEKKFLQADYDEFIDSLKEAAYKMSFEFKVCASSARGRNEKDARHELLCLSPYLGISAIFLHNQRGEMIVKAAFGGSIDRAKEKLSRLNLNVAQRELSIQRENRPIKLRKLPHCPRVRLHHKLGSAINH